jgi:hypothetical protein
VPRCGFQTEEVESAERDGYQRTSATEVAWRICTGMASAQDQSKSSGRRVLPDFFEVDYVRVFDAIDSRD